MHICLDLRCGAHDIPQADIVDLSGEELGRCLVRANRDRRCRGRIPGGGIRPRVPESAVAVKADRARCVITGQGEVHPGAGDHRDAGINIDPCATWSLRPVVPAVVVADDRVAVLADDYVAPGRTRGRGLDPRLDRKVRAKAKRCVVRDLRVARRAVHRQRGVQTGRLGMRRRQRKRARRDQRGDEGQREAGAPGCSDPKWQQAFRTILNRKRHIQAKTLGE